MNKHWHLAALVTVLAVSTVGCGSDQPDYDVATMCTTVSEPHIRLDPDQCPIGDGDVNGWPARWMYSDHVDHDQFVYVPVGQTVPVYYTAGRPPGVSTLRIYRDLPVTGTGLAPRRRLATAPSRQAAEAATPAAVPMPAKPAPVRNPDVKRGGFGAPSAPRATSSPRPFGTYSSGARSSGGSFSGGSSSSKGGKR